MNEKILLAVLSCLTTLYLLIDCISTCNTTRKLSALQTENETLKSIVFKSMERGLLRMIHKTEENQHED